MDDTKQIRVLAAVLGGSNMGFDLPTPETINQFLDWENWRQRDEDLDSIIARMWSGYMDGVEAEEAIFDECRSWLPRLLTMTEEQIRRDWKSSDKVALVGLGLGPVEIQLKDRMEVRRLMNLASYHYADDSTKEWGAADTARRDAARLMVKNRWTAKSIMKIHAWVRPIYTVEDTMNDVIKVLYDAIEVVKEIVQGEQQS